MGHHRRTWTSTDGSLLPFRWLMLLVGGGLVVRFVLEYLGLWPWA